MYPTLNWQQEALELIKEKYGVDLAVDAVTFALSAHEQAGPLSFTLMVREGEKVYTEFPLELRYTRRNIALLFVSHLPRVRAISGQTVEVALNALFAKYGLNINTNIFTPADLAKKVDLSGGSTQTLTATVVNDADELWFGTLTFEAVKDTVSDLAKTFTVVTPLNARYPEADDQARFQALDTFGITLQLSDGSAIEPLKAGDTLGGQAALQIANTLLTVDFNTAWDILTTCEVIYNGLVADAVASDELDPTLLPTMGSKVLVIKPAAETLITSKLYFSYN